MLASLLSLQLSGRFCRQPFIRLTLPAAVIVFPLRDWINGTLVTKTQTLTVAGHLGWGGHGQSLGALGPPAESTVQI